MKKATNKLMSFLAAFAMVLSVLVAPFTSANAAEPGTGDTPAATEETTKTLTIHKILMSEQGLKDHDVEKEGYNGTKINDIGTFFEKGAKEIDGVYFKLQELKDKDDTAKAQDYVNDDSKWQDVEGKAGLTGEKEGVDGLQLDTEGLKGAYRIVEDHEKSTYLGDKGETLTGMKAVPSIVVLPLVNNDGVVTDAHMYPKNTSNAPQIDKNFAKAKDGEKELEVAEGFEDAEEGAGVGIGAEYKNYQKKKATAEAQIGKKVPYEVKTQIPANSNLAEAKWDDKMTAGLTYNKDLVVTIGGNIIKPTAEELTQTDNGFVLKLQGANLQLLNKKEAPVEVVLRYSATVNSNAVVDIPEANDVNFFYGNTPSKATTPLPTKPNENGELTVKKTWDNGSAWVEGEYAKFKLVDANTGKDVTAADLVNAPADYKFEGTVTLSKGTRESYTWKYLNKGKQYKAIEIESKTLSDAEYTKAENGTIEVTNHKSNNPKPLNPTEPKVVLGGKKFVKTNQDGKERLAGAEFYVKNAAGEYLVPSLSEGNDVAAKKSALDDAVKAYNALTEEQQKGTEGTNAKAAIDKAQDEYNKAFKAAATKYEFAAKDAQGNVPANAVVLVSDSQGRFEITGLEYGDYTLEEKTAPAGYAKRSDTPKFKVEKGSYSTEDVDIKYNSNDADKSAKQVINKKVTIPQTGGIGSLIFIVAGLALMGVAFVAMKRRNSYEEA